MTETPNPVVTDTTPTIEQQEQKQELDRLMAQALGNGMPQSKDEPTKVEPTTQEPPKVEPVLIPFDTFTQKFGYNTAEDAIKEIEELRALKNAPQKPELKFENEESEQLFKAWQAGDKKKVLNTLNEQERIEDLTGREIDDNTADEIIKLSMHLKNKDLTAEEINFKFNKQFAIPKAPVQKEDETDEEYTIRKSDWQEQVNDIKMSKRIEAKLAKPELIDKKPKLVLPQIQDSVDEGYVQYKQMLNDNAKLSAETVDAYKTFTPQAIETKMRFIDEANKIDFEFQYLPDNESYAKAVAMVSDEDLLYQPFFDQDGKPDRKKFLEAVYFFNNRERILLEAMKQAKNATIKAMLPDNTQGGLVRHLPQTQEPTELDKQMQAHGIVRR